MELAVTHVNSCKTYYWLVPVVVQEGDVVEVALVGGTNPDNLGAVGEYG